MPRKDHCATIYGKYFLSKIIIFRPKYGCCWGYTSKWISY